MLKHSKLNEKQLYLVRAVFENHIKSVSSSLRAYDHHYTLKRDFSELEKELVSVLNELNQLYKDINEA